MQAYTGQELSSGVGFNKETVEALRNFVKTLKWDGVERLRNLPVAFKVGPPTIDTPLVELVKLIVKRLSEPGCIQDKFFILASSNECDASQALNILAGKYYSSSDKFFYPRSFYESSAGQLLYEIKRVENNVRIRLEQLSSILSDKKDNFYHRQNVRSAVLVGTTYDVEFKGNLHNFVTIKIKSNVDIDWIKENRYQLFAEAAHLLYKKELLPCVQHNLQTVINPFIGCTTMEQIDEILKTNTNPIRYTDIPCFCDLKSISIKLVMLGYKRYRVITYTREKIRFQSLWVPDCWKFSNVVIDNKEYELRRYPSPIELHWLPAQKVKEAGSQLNEILSIGRF